MSPVVALLALALAMEGAATAAAEPSAAAPKPAGTNFQGQPVPADERAPVAYELANGRIVFRLNVAGRDVWALLDTSTTRSMMDIELARSAGLTLVPIENPGNTIGSVPVHRATDVPILIPGQLEARHPALDVSDLSSLTSTLDRKIEFILSGDFLWHTALYIDPATQTFQLNRSGSFKPSLASREVRLLKAREAPFIEVTIGKENAIVGIATGARGPLYLAPAAWQRAIPKGATIGSATAGPGQPVVKSVVIPEIEIGSLAMKEVEARELPQQVKEDGFMGMAILGRFRIVLDVEAGKMWLGPVPPRAAQ